MPTRQDLPESDEGMLPQPEDQTSERARGGSGLALLRTLVLFAVLEKALGPRWGWPQAASEIIEQSRVVRYLEFGTACMALLVGILHIQRISARLVRQPEMVLFLLFVMFRGAIQPGDKISMVSVAFSYTEAYCAVAAVALYDGAGVMTKRLYQFFVFVILVDVAAFAVPSMSFMRGGELNGAYRGLYFQRNDLGYAASLALIFVMVESRQPLLRLVLAGLSLVLLVAAGSVQGFILSIIGVLFVAILRMTRNASHYRGLFLTILFIFLSAFYLLIPDLLNNVLGLFNRDASFDSRDLIWSLAFYMIQRMPLLGYGIQQFRSDILPEGVMTSFRLGTAFGSAHSSYLEAIIDLGWIGATFFFLVVIRQIANLASVILGRREVQYPAAVVIMMFCLVGGITASEKMFLPGAGWASFMIAKLLLEGESRKA